MSEEKETLDDIVRELRHDAEVVEERHDEDTWSGFEAAGIYRNLADRIEHVANNMECAFGMALAIKDGLPVVAIDGEHLAWDKHHIDDDVRFGCLAYGIEVPRPVEGGVEC